MDPNQQKEEFNYAYLSALAAHVGINRGDLRVDNDSVDVLFQSVGYRGRRFRNPQIQIQLKCTSQNLVRDGVIKFPLPRKNYDDLRGDDVITPRYLAVLLVPADTAQWIVHNDGHIALYNNCYWVSLRDYGPTDNERSVTVDVPLEQRLTGDTLLNMMDLASEGEWL
jgi:hypothetical protein